MYKFYEMFLSGTELWENDSNNILPNYFDHYGAAVTAFIIAVVVAVVLLFIFYGIFGMLFPKIGENRWIWVACLVASFFITFGVTDAVVIGTDEPQTGLYANIETQMNGDENASDPQYNQGILERAGSDQQARDEAYDAQRTMVTELNDGCSFKRTLDILNSLISVGIFLLSSILVKRLTKYSQNVPF